MNSHKYWHCLLILELIILFILLTTFGTAQMHAMRQVSALASGSDAKSPSESKKFIKWVDFKVTAQAMEDAYSYDKSSYGQKLHLNWVELLSYLGATYGGEFSRYRKKDLDQLVVKLMDGKTMEDLTKDLKYYPYYREAYGAVLDGLVGEFQLAEPGDSGNPETSADSGNSVDLGDSAGFTDSAGSENSSSSDNFPISSFTWTKQYGLKAYHPIAKGFPYNDFDDFGVARSYGYRRQHLGHDMMGQTGTPVIAVESGTVEALGWNQYGGWRIGIRSYDTKRYYYYAHLRKNYPYQSTLKVGSVVQAGDVIGYMGRTGYSAKENTNNIDETHLHFGLQLIFDESQKEGNNEIWVDCYQLVQFLKKHRCLTEKTPGTKEWHRVVLTKDG